VSAIDVAFDENTTPGKERLNTDKMLGAEVASWQA
jgi:hypothetical protein